MWVTHAGGLVLPVLKCLWNFLYIFPTQKVFHPPGECSIWALALRDKEELITELNMNSSLGTGDPDSITFTMCQQIKVQTSNIFTQWFERACFTKLKTIMRQTSQEEEFNQKNVNENWELFKNTLLDVPKATIKLVKKLTWLRGQMKAAIKYFFKWSIAKGRKEKLTEMNINQDCRNLIREAKWHMTKSMTSWVKDNKKELLKYIRNKLNPNNGTGPLSTQMAELSIIMETGCRNGRGGMGRGPWFHYI